MLKTVDHAPAPHLSLDPDIQKIIDEVIEANREIPGGLMVVLNELQSRVGYVSEPMQLAVAQKMQIPVSTVHGVISFYSFFTTSPRGRHTIKFCMGTACYVGGMPQLIEKAKQVLQIEPGQTTEDGNITLELCRCVGACSQAPVIVVDEEIYGRMRPNKFPQIIRSITEKDKQETA
jgi:NADH:ubiquinone oxidoreductase subunit E